MPLSTLENGDTGLDSRTKINAAIALLNASTPTGTRITGYWPTAPSGYVLANGSSIGNAASGADRANTDTQALFNILWQMYYAGSGFGAVLLDSTGSATATIGNPTDDWTANFRMSVPDERGRAPVNADAGISLDGVTLYLGASGGHATHTLSADELASHTHSETAHTHSYDSPTSGTPTSVVIYDSMASSLGLGSTSISVTVGGATTGFALISSETGSSGTGSSHNNVQPFIAVNVAIKL